MGDAVHRHSPANGLGSNTSIQDGFNLAWKLSLVIKGRAQPQLLESFDAERRPVGEQVVARATKSFMANAMMWDLFGAGIVIKKTPEERAALFTTAQGRAQLYQALDAEMPPMWHAHGVEMTRRYQSAAVVPDGSPEPLQTRDAEIYHEPSARPGSAVPHAWLVRREPSPCVSTLDLAGKDRFHLFTGHGGSSWREAAAEVSSRFGVEIGVTAIGPQLDYEDPYGTWRRTCDVAVDGCVLVRPDLIVAWRSHSLRDEPAQSLGDAMDRILGYAT